LQTPPGRYVLAWEQERLDRAVANAFGFHALQLGLPELEGLRANRMPHRWVAADALVVPEPVPLPPLDDDLITTRSADAPLSLYCQFEALPFPNDSIDLVVLAHSLELTRDPHQRLREVERVLRPEGRLLIVGFNPASLWGLRQRAGRIRSGHGDRPLFMPRSGEFIGYWRLRDWLRLLGMEIDGGRFGCYRPPLGSSVWLDRFGWMDRVGESWWPVLGAVYFLSAVKRVRGMRLVGLAKAPRRKAHAAPAVASHREPVARVERSAVEDVEQA
jgi:SAM-dependent methyltransferase